MIDGSRTPIFLRFKRNFMAGASAHFLHEDDYSVWQACLDQDQGGNAAGADAMPGNQQAGHANAVRRRKRRQQHMRTSAPPNQAAAQNSQLAQTTTKCLLLLTCILTQASQP